MKPGSNVKAPWSLLMLAMLMQSGPTDPLRASRTDFLPVSVLTSSYFLLLILVGTRIDTRPRQPGLASQVCMAAKFVQDRTTPLS